MSNETEIKPQYRIKTTVIGMIYYYSAEFDWEQNPSYAIDFYSEDEALGFALKHIEREDIIIEKFYRLYGGNK